MTDLEELLQKYEYHLQELSDILKHHSTFQTKSYDEGRYSEVNHFIMDLKSLIEKEEK